MTLGNKIRKYRKDRRVSQLELELEIETSPGRISKIENGIINPDKETIIKIAYALKLDTPDIASLFGISIPKLEPLFNIINRILICREKNEVIELTVNDLVLKLGFIASALFLVENDRVYLRGLTSSSLSQKAIQVLKKPLDDSYMILSRDLENLTVKSINTNSMQITDYTYRYCTPLISKEVADEVQRVTGDKSAVIFPLIVKDEKIGALAFVKKISSDFLNEQEILKVISTQIAIALFNSR